MEKEEEENLCRAVTFAIRERCDQCLKWNGIIFNSGGATLQGRMWPMPCLKAFSLKLTPASIEKYEPTNQQTAFWRFSYRKLIERSRAAVKDPLEFKTERESSPTHRRPSITYVYIRRLRSFKHGLNGLSYSIIKNTRKMGIDIQMSDEWSLLFS